MLIYHAAVYALFADNVSPSINRDSMNVKNAVDGYSMSMLCVRSQIRLIGCLTLGFSSRRLGLDP